LYYEAMSSPPTAYALLCRRDLPAGARHTQLFSDPARRHHLVTLARECAEGEAAADALGRPMRVTWATHDGR
jgi:hypothetical protein